LRDGTIARHLRTVDDAKKAFNPLVFDFRIYCNADLSPVDVFSLYARFIF